MGCAQSRIENEESVSRCRERRNLLKEAIYARNAFASAHSGYSISLKDTGAALTDYAEGEVPPPPMVAAAPSDTPPHPAPMTSSLPPPPPPLPSFSPMPPLQRAVTMATALSSENRKEKLKGIAIDKSDIYEDEKEEKEGFHRRKKGVESPKKASPNPTTPPEIRGVAWDYFFMDNMPNEGEEEDEEEGYGEGVHENIEAKLDNVGENTEFRTPEKKVRFEGIEEFKTPVGPPVEKKFLHSNTAPPAMSRVVNGGNVVGNNNNNGGNVVGNNSNNGVDFLKIVSDIDDHFVKAYQSSQEVSKMLEATRLHYHSIFADNRGHIDHAARVMQVITWNKSFRGVPKDDGTKDNFGAEVYETHATVLDKLLAWEKKLYEELKTSELMKREYNKKVAVLNKLKKRNIKAEQLEKAKAAVIHLHSRYIVDMQSLDSTVSVVNDIRDKQLFPKLTALVYGMATMWQSMCEHHDSQLRIVANLKFVDFSGILIETSTYHHERTKQLASVIDQWHSHLEELVTNQRLYINALNSWLKLNLFSTESTLREKVSSPSRTPIQPLLQSWHDHLEKLPDEVVKSAIASFAAIMKTILVHQEEEMKLKEKCEETRREYIRKKQGFEEWYQKYARRRAPSDEAGPREGVEMGGKDPVSERQFVVESLKKRLEKEMEEHQKQCVQVRERSLGSLKIRLPELFRALSEYAHACLDLYERLRLVTQQANGGS